MNAIPDTARARRYLLGLASEDEAAAVEHEYFADQDAVDRIAAAEDDLIEDYLADQLSRGDRERFERDYLASPPHRVRVETIRRLMAQGSRSAPGPSKISAISPRRLTRYRPWLALAASLLIVASVALWLFAPSGRKPAVVDNGGSVPPAAGAPTGSSPSRGPVTFALTLSPVAIRGASDSPPTAIPAGTDVVTIRLERDADNRPLIARRAAVRTVAGVEVWQGAVTAESTPVPGVAARIDVPAAKVPADDYLITLYGTDRAGAEKEWAQYFLRVRAR
jgi:hypothetical protein